MSFFEVMELFKNSNKGFVIDGYNKRLSRESSFQNLLITGASGTGKSSVYMYSNIFTLAKNRQKNSLIISDPKMDFINKCSGYLKKNGYEIYSLNPLNLEQSIYYNPLVNCKSDSDLDQLSRIIISSAYSGNIKQEDKFWLNGAIKFIFIISHCLINTKKTSIMNLPNVLHCLNSFGNKGQGLDKFIAKYASTKIYNMWLGLINSPENVLLSFLSTAQNALVSIGVNQNVEKILSKNTFNFKDLREKKIAIFINIPPQFAEQMSFISNLFYTQMFEALTPIPTKKQCDVFTLLDEIGQYKISKLHTYTTFLRQSRVGFMLLIQDYNQLISKYGANNASVIVNGGVSTKVYFTDTEINTAQELSKRIGQKKIKQQNGGFIKDEIMPLNEVLTMKKNEVLFFHSSYKPVKLKVKKYFEVPKFKIYSNLKPYIKTNQINFNVPYIDFRSL